MEHEPGHVLHPDLVPDGRLQVRRRRNQRRRPGVGSRVDEEGWLMIPTELLSRVVADVRRHCEAKGHCEGAGVNNFVPHDWTRSETKGQRAAL